MLKQIIIKSFFLFILIFIKIKADDNLEISSFLLNVPTKGSLSDNSYHFYKLTLDQISQNNNQNLILRVDEDKSIEITENTQYYFN